MRKFDSLLSRSAFGAVAIVLSSSTLASSGDLAELSLEDLLKVSITSATRFEQLTTEAPASTTVIDEEELRSHGYRNIAEALVTAPGVFTSGDRNYTYLGVRGFNRPGDYGTRILLLTDGARRNDPLYDQALLGNEAPVELDWIKRIEFVSGPASAIYGANAIFGTVNAVMLEGGDVNGVKASVDVGTSNSRRLNVMSGQRLDGEKDWFFGFSTYKSQGENLYIRAFDNGSTNGHSQGLDGESYNKAYAKFRAGNWRFSGNFSWREKGDPTANYGTTFGQPGTNTLDQSRLIELRYDGDTVSGFQPSLRIYNGSYSFTGNYNYAPQPDARDSAKASWTGTEFRLAYSEFEKHKLLFGADAQWNQKILQRYFQTNPYSSILDTNNPSQSFALYAQDEWRFSPNWLLNIGLRYDKHSQFSGVTSPRVALIWQTTPRLTLKAITGSSYRIPNAYERFYSDGGASQAANPLLKPEYIRTNEISSTYRFGTAGSVGVSIYDNNIVDLIDANSTASGVSTYANQNRVNSHGIEINAENRWDNGLRLRGSLAMQHSQLLGGAFLGDSPKRMAKLIASSPLGHGWTASSEFLALSGRTGSQGAVPGYGLINLSILSPISKKLGRITLSVYNLADRQYWDPAAPSMTQAAIEQSHRQIRVRWSLDF